MNAVNETLISGGGIYGAIHECQKLNGCETGGCKVTLQITC